MNKENIEQNKKKSSHLEKFGPFEEKLSIKSALSTDLAKLKDNYSIENDPKRKYPCPYGCGYIAPRSDTLKRHINSKHLNYRPYKCPIKKCRYAAVESYALKTHLLTHENKYRFKCQLCAQDKAYQTNYRKNLKLHIKSKHEHVKDFKCPFGSKSFDTKDHLLRHISSIHLKLRPFKCKSCLYQCSRKDALKVHIRTHTGDYPYLCEECGFHALTSSHLNQHKLAEKNIKAFKCDYKECKACFINKSKLKRHKNSHLLIKPFQCKGCSRTFPSNYRLNEHKERYACWRSELSWYVWENLCVQRIAPILLKEKNWEPYPTIEAPDIEGRKFIRPEIAVYNQNGIEEIIDAKRTARSPTTKDKTIYPEFTERVVFWCLHGKSKKINENNKELVYLNSKDLIQKLEENKNQKNSKEINSIIEKITTLKQFEQI